MKKETNFRKIEQNEGWPVPNPWILGAGGGCGGMKRRPDGTFDWRRKRVLLQLAGGMVEFRRFARMGVRIVSQKVEAADG
jgi:hypothetical protein